MCGRDVLARRVVSGQPLRDRARALESEVGTSFQGSAGHGARVVIRGEEFSEFSAIHTSIIGHLFRLHKSALTRWPRDG